jgi:hypothetical protein
MLESKNKFKLVDSFKSETIADTLNNKEGDNYSSEEREAFLANVEKGMLRDAKEAIHFKRFLVGPVKCWLTSKDELKWNCYQKPIIDADSFSFGTVETMADVEWLCNDITIKLNEHSELDLGNNFTEEQYISALKDIDSKDYDGLMSFLYDQDINDCMTIISHNYKILTMQMADLADFI